MRTTLSKNMEKDFSKLHRNKLLELLDLDIEDEGTDEEFLGDEVDFFLHHQDHAPYDPEDDSQEFYNRRIYGTNVDGTKRKRRQAWTP